MASASRRGCFSRTLGLASLKQKLGTWIVTSPRAAASRSATAAEMRWCAGADTAITQFVSTRTCFTAARSGVVFAGPRGAQRTAVERGEDVRVKGGRSADAEPVECNALNKAVQPVLHDALELRVR
jgi:hypothetical protein